MTLLKDDRDHLHIAFLVIVIRIEERGGGGDDDGLGQLVQGRLHVELVHLVILPFLVTSTQHRLWQLEDLFWKGEDQVRLRRVWVVVALPALL